MDISVRQLRAFVAVAKLRSFTQAATQLHLSQPTLTVQIRRLEQVLHLRLFDRNPRSVDLTRIGRELLPAFERTLQDLDSVLTGVRDIASERRGVVRLAALPSFAAGFLPDAIREFRQLHTGVSFVLKDVIASRVIALVRAEEVDLGLTGGDVNFADVEVVLSARDEMAIVYPHDHPVGAAHRITAELLAGHPLVLMDPGTSVRAVTDAAFNKVGLMPSPASEATYMMTAIGMVRAGIGLAILPASAREIAAEPGLRARRIDDPNFSRPVALIKKAGRSLPPLSQAFSQFIFKNRKMLVAKAAARPRK